MQQTMLRIKDPKISIPFYEANFGMKLIHHISFPQWKFTVYFLERQREGQSSPECTLEKATVESERCMPQPALTPSHPRLLIVLAACGRPQHDDGRRA